MNKYWRKRHDTNGFKSRHYKTIPNSAQSASPRSAAQRHYTKGIRAGMTFKYIYATHIHHTNGDRLKH